MCSRRAVIEERIVQERLNIHRVIENAKAASDHKIIARARAATACGISEAYARPDVPPVARIQIGNPLAGENGPLAWNESGQIVMRVVNWAYVVVTQSEVDVQFACHLPIAPGEEVETVHE